jgi:hypothetical protein
MSAEVIQLDYMDRIWRIFGLCGLGIVLVPHNDNKG